MPGELQTALSLCLSVASDPYAGVMWEFYPPDTVKLIGTNGHRLTIVTLSMTVSDQSRFRMTPEDCREVLALTGEQPVLPWDDMLVVGNLCLTADPAEYPPSAGELHYRHASDSPLSSYTQDDVLAALCDCHMVSNGTVQMDLLTYRSLLIEPVLREDLQLIRRVQMAVLGRRPV